MPVIAVGELYFGAHYSTKVEANLKRLEQLMAVVPVLGWETTTAECYGGIKKLLRSQGIPYQKMICGLPLSHSSMT